MKNSRIKCFKIFISKAIKFFVIHKISVDHIITIIKKVDSYVIMCTYNSEKNDIFGAK